MLCLWKIQIRIQRVTFGYLKSHFVPQFPTPFWSFLVMISFQLPLLHLSLCFCVEKKPLSEWTWIADFMIHHRIADHDKFCIKWMGFALRTLSFTLNYYFSSFSPSYFLSGFICSLTLRSLFTSVLHIPGIVLSHFSGRRSLSASWIYPLHFYFSTLYLRHYLNLNGTVLW